MQEEIYRSFDRLEINGTESGYIVYKCDNYYEIKHLSLDIEQEDYPIRLNAPLEDWSDGLALAEAEIEVRDGVRDGQAWHRGKWYSTKTINKIQYANHDYNWRAYAR